MARKTIEQLFSKHDGKVSDKWSSYLKIYESILSRYRDDDINIMEIGIQNGGSLEIWSEYFENAEHIIGCDINPDCANLIFNDPRIVIVFGDANSDNVENEILGFTPNYHIIIDDGSHHSREVLGSFARYFPHLANGGVYIIEDLHASYWKEYDGGLFHPYSSLTFFKRLVDVLNNEHWGVDKSRKEFFTGIFSVHDIQIAEDDLKHIHSIEFFNSMCLIHKVKPEHNNLGRRVVAGTLELVRPGLKELDGRLYSPELATGYPKDQNENEWTVRDLPPEEEVDDLVRSIKDREEIVEKLNLEIARQVVEIKQANKQTKLARSLAEDKYTKYKGQLADQEQEIEKLVESNIELKSVLNQQITDLESRLTKEEAERVEISGLLAASHGEIALLRSEIKTIFGTRSWLITAPLRSFMINVRATGEKFRMHFPSLAVVIYRITPLPKSLKLWLRNATFRLTSPLFRHTRAYWDWDASRQSEDASRKTNEFAVRVGSLRKYVIGRTW